MHVQNSAAVDDAPAARLDRPTALERRSVVLMILLSVATLGLYYPLWFLRRRAALNSLDSPRKLDAWPFVLCLGYWIAQFGIAVAARGLPVEAAFGQGISSLLSLAQVGVGIVMVVQCFYIRDILEDHLAGPEDAIPAGIHSNSVQPSRMMTLFFQNFYLQYVINRYVAREQPSAV